MVQLRVTFAICLAAIGLMLLFMLQASATTGRCILEVDGKTYLNGPCEIDIGPGGSFSVGVAEESTNASKWFAYVNLDPDGHAASGSWNGKVPESHAHDDLGMLRKHGACWVNQRARICAFAEKEMHLQQRAKENPCRNSESLDYVEKRVSTKLGMHIDTSTASVSPYAGPDNGKAVTICLVAIPTLGISVVYSVKRAANGYITEILGP